MAVSDEELRAANFAQVGRIEALWTQSDGLPSVGLDVMDAIEGLLTSAERFDPWSREADGRSMDPAEKSALFDEALAAWDAVVPDDAMYVSLRTAALSVRDEGMKLHELQAHHEAGSPQKAPRQAYVGRPAVVSPESLGFGS